MPLGEIASELLGPIFRFIGHFFVEIVLEIMIKAPGYLVARLFSRNVDPDGFTAFFVGIILWATVIGAAVVIIS